MAFVDPRAVGEALWPSKYPLDELKRRRAMAGEYDWSALYMGVPVPSGGGLFREVWFAGKFVDVAPAVMRVARGWDTAGTDGGGDWTCGVKIGEEFISQGRSDGTTSLTSSGRFFVLDVVRRQLGPFGVDDLMKVTAELDGVACPQREEREGGGSGVAVIAAHTKLLVGYDHKEVSTTGSKITRSRPFRSQCEAGNVYIVRDKGVGGATGTGWNRDYIQELIGFPTAKHDDQVDASSAAFNSVLLEPAPQEDWVTW